MSASTIPSCPAGVTAEQLSAWRDASLSEADTHRLEAHAATCPACQARLEEYASIAAVLRVQPAPVPDERLWRGVQARMVVRRHRADRVHASGRLWKSLGAVAAVALLVVGFAQLLSGYLGIRSPAPRPTATLASTAAPRPHPLAWQPTGQQLGSLSPGGLFTVANALTDGNTAYACHAQPSGSSTRFAVWVTHDRAAHWTQTAAIPFTLASASDGQCSLAVDASNSSTVVVSVGWQGVRQGVDLSSAATFVTTDAGASWRRLTDAQPSIVEQIASRQGITYAVRSTGTQPAQVTLGLWASGDGMRTWQPIDRGIGVPGGQVQGFWLNPSTGAILANVSGTADAPPPLWQTTDGGQHWTPVNVPEMRSGLFEVQAPTGVQQWHICEMYYNYSSRPSEANQLWCTTDGGRTWLSRPTLGFTYTCLKCSVAPTPTTQTFPMSLIGITSDNAILAITNVPVGTAVVPASPNETLPVQTLYRLPAGSTAWQSLGALPSSGSNAGTGVLYIPAPPNGVLWAFGDYSHYYTVAYP